MIVLDTNVVSEIMKPQPSSAVTSWISNLMLNELFTTVVTVGEVLYGIELLPKGKRRDTLLRAAEAVLTKDFAGHILTFDEPTARAYASLSASRRTHGRPISTQDAQIAAIARVHGATVATRNTDDFEGCGVKLVNPWEG